MSCLRLLSAAGAWVALGAASAGADWRLVHNQGALPLRVLTGADAPTGEQGRTVLPGGHVLLPMVAGDSVWVHCAAAQDVVVSSAGSGLSVGVSGGAANALTDAQLRATAVSVSGPVTDAQMAARAYALDGTDSTGVAQLAGGAGMRGWLSGIFSKLPSSVGQKTSAQSLSVVVASDQTQSTKDTNGTGAVRYTTGTAAITGTTFSQLVCLTTTTFSLFTRTGAVGDALTGVALPPGTLLIGPITAYTLSSGAVAAYV